MASAATLSPFIPTPISQGQIQISEGKKYICRFKEIGGKIGMTLDEGKTISTWLASPAKFKPDANTYLLFEVQDLFLNMMEATSKTGGRTEYKNFRATVFKQFTETSSELVAESLRSKRLALFSFVAGVLQEIWIHKDWVAKMEKNDALGELVIDFGDKDYSHPQEDLDLTTLTDEGYNEMITKTLLKA